ncbi:acyl-CoA dehydrogenase [Shewanella marina]|uniref:acyl-CoA dehydrogenase n=1 Tax=Shewanella marina TaxID=487319 RepID=UPI00056CCC23|nr:acyl-CoA dehydrogenase [Shewanella marina]
MSILLLVLLIIIVLLAIKEIRQQILTRPIFAFFKRVLPPLSETEQQAMEAGDTWWESELFQGNPDWNKLHDYGKPLLTAEEKYFIDHQVSHLLSLLDDHQIVADQDLPAEVWQYLKKQGFFALIISKHYGGKDFSAYACSTIVSLIASRSISAAVTVMVPNSLGPGELLSHYGTQAQKDYWLPALAKGEHIPCFALTGPDAGSDASAIPDTGIVCYGEFEGEQVLGLRLNWDKRYITLAPVATVLGLAFKMYDPDCLLSEKTDLGITCALIPTKHQGVNTGERHHPMGLAFMNGTTYGNDVFIPLDWIIGGAQYAGQGWRMLVECLSAGRGISLPALATASAHMATKTTTAYSYIRHQFGMPIGQFEGVQSVLARLVANTYQLEAARQLTTTGIDLKVKPSVVTAIAKYHMTELGREVITDAMDIHAGKAIQLGPKNYLGLNYFAQPIAITVEGANILTRNLMIFGQGATRCHPYVLAEMQAAMDADDDSGLVEFDKLLLQHLKYTALNKLRAFGAAITGSRFIKSPVSGETKQYYQHLTRLSSALALMADVAMLMYGGDLKRKEMMSARLGDALSHLYLASATLKMFEDNGRQHDDLPIVHHVLTTRLHDISHALSVSLDNFDNKLMGFLLRLVIFPLGNHFKGVTDKQNIQLAQAMLKPSPARNRLTFLCAEFELDNSGIAEVEQAFIAMHAAKDCYKKINKAQKIGLLPKAVPFEQILTLALQQEIITEAESKQLQHAQQLRDEAIAVDVD